VFWFYIFENREAYFVLERKDYLFR